VPRADGATLVVAGDRVAQLSQQLLQLRATTVDVADQVERAGLAALVVQQRLDLDRRGVDLLHRAQHVHPPETLLRERAK
jgi:hypothetical protein